MKTHLLKTDPIPFEAVWIGAKTFEIRFNDRDFKVNDTLVLQETRHTGEQMLKAGAPLEFTGREIKKRVSHILCGPVYGLADGWCILSFYTK